MSDRKTYGRAGALGRHGPRRAGGMPQSGTAQSSTTLVAPLNAALTPQRGVPTRTRHLLTRAALLTVILFGVTGVRAQELPITGSANDFNSVEYYGAPHQQDIRRLFSGAEAQPLPGGLLLIKQVKIEEFDLDGKLKYVAEAPECIYDPVNVVANSPGEIHVRYGDGQLKIDGEGFLWRQKESVLTISNQVETVFDRLPAPKR